ncbi:MAG TPA: LysR family transcriptional regulator [Nonomuraea sp.]|nr:LysR family transcriptional regulator [Nonomuraea sp.]
MRHDPADARLPANLRSSVGRVRAITDGGPRAEELHVGRAARRHNITPQPFGRHIRRLEREVGRPLFHRTSRRVALTPEGTRFVDRARSILADLDDLVVSLREHPRPEG